MLVLVTGFSGAIGHTVTRGLQAAGHRVRGFDRSEPGPRGGDCVVGELSDRRALDAAAKDVEVVVHLAATPDRADFLSDLLPNNIAGTYNVYEAAIAAGARRVVYASTARVASGLHGDGPASAAHGFAPMDFYALTKCCGELMGQMYARRGSLSVICARIGWYVRNRKEAERLEASQWGRRAYLSHRDAARFFRCAVEAPPDVSFAQLFVASRPEGEPAYDLTAARDSIGYEPIDSFPDGSSFDETPEYPTPAGAGRR